MMRLKRIRGVRIIQFISRSFVGRILANEHVFDKAAFAAQDEMNIIHHARSIAQQNLKDHKFFLLILCPMHWHVPPMIYCNHRDKNSRNSYLVEIFPSENDFTIVYLVSLKVLQLAQDTTFPCRLVTPPFEIIEMDQRIAKSVPFLQQKVAQSIVEFVLRYENQVD